MNDNDVKLPLQKLRFTPLKQFRDGMSEYLPGLVYTVRPGNEVLLEKVMQWVNDGTVELGGDPALGKTITGTLRVI